MASSPHVEESEIDETVLRRFAQKLAGNEKKTRDIGLKRLRKWMINRASGAQGAFTEADMMKLWKGLHYCMWMSDKPLVQEELADRLAGLIDCFSDDLPSAFLFIDTFFQTEAREWPLLDRLRLDKFMMLIRKFLNKSFALIHSHNWKKKHIQRLLEILSTHVINATNTEVPLGLKLHIVDIYLDELEKVGVGEISSKTVQMFVEPYWDFIAMEVNAKTVQRVIKNVFDRLVDYAIDEEESDSDDEQDEEDQEMKEPSPKFEIDYSELADGMMEVASRKECRAKNRKTMYRLVKKFRDLAQGIFPQEAELSSGEEEINQTEISLAVDRLHHLETALLGRKNKKKRDRKRKKRKQNQDTDSEDNDSDDDCGGDDDDDDDNKPARKKRKTSKSMNDDEDADNGSTEKPIEDETTEKSNRKVKKKKKKERKQEDVTENGDVEMVEEENCDDNNNAMSPENSTKKKRKKSKKIKNSDKVESESTSGAVKLKKKKENAVLNSTDSAKPELNNVEKSIKADIVVPARRAKLKDLVQQSFMEKMAVKVVEDVEPVKNEGKLSDVMSKILESNGDVQEDDDADITEQLFSGGFVDSDDEDKKAKKKRKKKEKQERKSLPAKLPSAEGDSIKPQDGFQEGASEPSVKSTDKSAMKSKKSKRKSTGSVELESENSTKESMSSNSGESAIVENGVDNDEEGEFEILIPNKKYKGKFKEAFQKEIEKSMGKSSEKKKKSPGSNFASFEKIMKTPPAFVKKSVAKAMSGSKKSPKTPDSTEAPASADGSNRRVSFGLHKNMEQEFHESLNKSPALPFDPEVTPNQGILKPAKKKRNSLGSSPKLNMQKKLANRRPRAEDFF